MERTHKFWIAPMATAALLVSASWLHAQAPRAEQRPRVDTPNQLDDTRNPQQNQQRNTQQNTQQLTAQLANWLSMSNHSQVELGKMAADKSDSPEIQKFARTMVDEHSQLNKQLQQFTTTTENTARTSTQQPDALMEIGQTAARYKLGLTQKLLDKYQGQDFDMGYLGQQLVAHVEMLATLEAMKGHGSPEFQQVVTRGIEATKNHLQEAHALSVKFEDDRRKQGAQDNPRQPSPEDPRFDRNRPSDTPRLDDTRPRTDTSPRPRLDSDLDDASPEVDSDIRPRATIKENRPLTPQPEGDIQP